jgi:hypothetical protein
MQLRMRTLPVLAGFLASLAAASLSGCSDEESPPVTDDDDDDDDVVGDPDAGSSELAPPEQGKGFQIISPEVVLAPGDEKTFCFYTSVPLDQAVGVKRWESQMTPGSHHLIVYFVPDEGSFPEGEITENCGLAGTGIWTYASQSPYLSQPLPDGIGMQVGARQKLYVQMHYLNAGTQELRAHVAVNGHTFDSGESYVPAAAYVTYDTRIRVEPHAAGFVEDDCAVPDGLKFFTVSTHAHRFSTKTEVRDGDSMIFQSEDWEHPGTKDWADPFYQFQNSLHYRCEYQNDTDDPVVEGQSAVTNEMCMAVGYVFPSEQPVFCYDGQLLTGF